MNSIFISSKSKIFVSNLLFLFKFSKFVFSVVFFNLSSHIKFINSSKLMRLLYFQSFILFFVFRYCRCRKYFIFSFVRFPFSILREIALFTFIVFSLFSLHIIQKFSSKNLYTNQ